MDKTAVMKMMHRMEEDAQVIGKIITKSFGSVEVLDADTKHEMERSIQAILSTMETADSFMGTFEKHGKDRFVSTDRIIKSTAKVINQSVC